MFLVTTCIKFWSSPEKVLQCIHIAVKKHEHIHIANCTCTCSHSPSMFSIPLVMSTDREHDRMTCFPRQLCVRVRKLCHVSEHYKQCTNVSVVECLSAHYQYWIHNWPETIFLLEWPNDQCLDARCNCIFSLYCGSLQYQTSVRSAVVFVFTRHKSHNPKRSKGTQINVHE